MPSKKTGGTGYEGIDERKQGGQGGFDQSKKDQGQGGFDKDMNKDIGGGKSDVGSEKHGIGSEESLPKTGEGEGSGNLPRE